MNRYFKAFFFFPSKRQKFLGIAPEIGFTCYWHIWQHHEAEGIHQNEQL